MAYDNTYVALDKVIVGTATPSVTFSSIPSTYTDLVLIVTGSDNRGGGALDDGIGITFNSDTSTGSTNYSFTTLVGNGSAVTTSVSNNNREIDAYGIGTTSNANPGVIVAHIMNYASTSVYKTVISKGGISGALSATNAGAWRNNAAISSITIWPGYNGSGYNFSVGSTFSLYGVLASGTNPAAKATGGTITYSADGYTYHTFTSSGTFTPSVALTCDYLVVAGGGGGSLSYGGGGGAGGLRSTVGFTGGLGTLESALSLSATAYTVTIGAGGGNDTSGSNSVFGSITSTGGGRGGSYQNSHAGGDGGSGGGSGSNGGVGVWLNGGAANPSGQGFAGGSSINTIAAGAGGGGAGAIGLNSGSSGMGGDGGIGVSISAFSKATNTGVSTYYAGGGGGGSTIGGGDGTLGGAGGLGGGATGSKTAGGTGSSATANTGGGGGGGGYNGNGGSGGSGIVIIRYAS